MLNDWFHVVHWELYNPMKTSGPSCCRSGYESKTTTKVLVDFVPKATTFENFPISTTRITTQSSCSSKKQKEAREESSSESWWCGPQQQHGASGALAFTYSTYFNRPCNTSNERKQKRYSGSATSERLTEKEKHDARDPKSYFNQWTNEWWTDYVSSS